MSDEQNHTFGLALSNAMTTGWSVGLRGNKIHVTQYSESRLLRCVTDGNAITSYDEFTQVVKLKA